MSDLNNCFSCIHYNADEGFCSNYPGTDKYPEPIEDPEKERECFDLEPWIAKERLENLQSKLCTLQAQHDEAVKVLEFYADHNNWLYNEIAKTKDVNIITKGVPRGLEFESGGKRAREFLAKIKRSPILHG